MRNHTFEIGEYYHIYNRGVDKRNIFSDEYDLKRFLQSLKEFNNVKPIGSIYQLSFKKEELGRPTSKLVSITAYCLNPNHFHLLITPQVAGGIEEFMKRLGGYTKYFNEKHKRNGSLFQGKFKSKHIPNDKYLLHLSAYINMNNRDLLGRPTSKLSQSSLEEYIDEEFNKNKSFCNTNIVLDQFKNKSTYKKYALETWRDIKQRKLDLSTWTSDVQVKANPRDLHL